MTEPATEVVDAVVIGAGHNGLVAANLLADAGWDVLILEATDQPGGAVRTGETTAPGFHNDHCSAFYPLSAASPVIIGLGLDRHGLRWRHAPAVLAHVLPDDRAAVIHRDVARTAESVGSFAPADAEAWEREFRIWQRIRDDVLAAILSPFPPVRAGGRLLRRLGAGGALRISRRAVLPARRLGYELFEGEGARLLLAGSAMHTDLGPDQGGSGMFGWLLAMLAQEVGFPAAEGGAGRITDALVHRLLQAGGRLSCGRRVDKVLVAGGRAMGVRDEHDGLVRARRAVLADVPAPTLYLQLVGAGELPPTLVEDLTRFDWDDATIKVDWALSGPIPWIAAEVAKAGTVHLGADLDGLAGISNDLACGRVPRNPFLLLGQMTTTDPTRSPAGTESAWAYTHVPHEQQWNQDRLRRYADRIERVIEAHAPGFRDRIIARAVVGPRELEAGNPSMVDGAINAGTAGIHQQLFFRPVPGLARADTPVDRLYLAGASAHPGGAVHGGPGSNAARSALRREGWWGSGYRAGIRAANRAIYR
ncbi:MAG TPA: NAD(P)/FAD-dependent oxidoreductase [Pseudonocardiaceae bacterium]|nr:NAD(P)/FAD-dependent oxidoreductase [Pseudonocardiaceae bacterium]